MLTVAIMNKVASSYLSGRKPIDKEDEVKLLSAIQTLGIQDKQTFKSLFKEYLKPALEYDKNICQKMLANYKENGDLGSVNGYVADLSDLKEIQKGRYFTRAGIIRMMLELKYGEESNGIIREGASDEEYPEEETED